MSAEHLDLPSLAGRQNLRDQVAQRLRAALIAGKMRPGVVYSAPALASTLAVSATPVREAMLDLAKEGLVEPVRNKGFRVTELSDSDLNDFTDIRMLVEVPVVADLARGAVAPRLEALRPLVDAIVAAARAGDLSAFVEADNRFHLELLALHGNAHLVAVVADLRNRSRLYGLTEHDEFLVPSALEHEEILGHLLTGDAAATHEAMQRHLRHVRGIWAGPARAAVDRP